MEFRSSEINVDQLDPLVSRRVLPHCDGLMAVQVMFKKGGIGKAHTHTDHEQITYIVEGSFEAVIGDKITVLNKGDGFTVPKNVLHGLTALEDGMVLDVFTPIRKDFL